MKHTDQHHILPDQKHGSDETNRNTVISNNPQQKQYVDEKKSVDIVMLGFTNVFNEVPHDKLIHKLQYYGTTGSLYQYES